MSVSRPVPLASWFIRIIVVSLLPLAAWGEDLEANRTEIGVGETATLRIPDSMGLVKPNWKATPKGIVDFEDKGSKKAVVRGVAPGRANVSAKVLGTTYSTDLTVTDKPAFTTKPGQPSAAGTSSGAQGDTQSKTTSAEARAIGDLLKNYESKLAGAGLLDRFRKQDSGAEGSKPRLSDTDAARLGAITEAFFKELGGLGLSVQKLQGFKDDFKAAGPGGSPLFPGQGAWDGAFLGTERALMMGRATLVQKLWMESLQDTFKNNPDAAVFGEIDIGSWVKMQLSGLGFEADIDFSSVSIDPDLNRWIVDQFQNKLNDHTSLGMIKADALLTAHGQATADVFIGDWGKTFAELDMLKRSKWKVIKVEKNPDGSLALDENGQPKIRMIEKPGAQLFWEVAFRKLEAVMAANGGKLPHELPNPYEFEVDHPKMGLDKEPMLSLEMLRHGIHDIEHGPYTRGQKLIKMLKYAERSYFMSKKAVSAYGFNPYADNDPTLAQAAENIIANKNDPEKVADLLRALSGENITADNVDAVTDKLVARAKTAMHDNAARALAFRLNAIAKIDADAARQQAAEKLWRDLGTELDTFRETSGDPPRIMVEAQEMAKAVMEGKLPPAELEAKANELHKLLNDAYKLPDSVIDRILMSDSVLKLKAYLRKLGWVEKAIDDFTNKAKQKFPNVANFHGKVMELNEQLEKTTSGSVLLKAADWADNAFTVYEAYLNSDASDALWNASLAMGRVGAQSYFPSMQIPFAVYDSFKSGSPKPLGMAVAFMYFPFAGQTYMVSTQMQRADVAMRDSEFYAALNKVLEITQFDTQGKITGFSLRNIIGKEIDSESISPPGNRKAIVALFTKPDSTFYVSPNFRYWSSLVPKQDDRFGRYENKLQNLRRFFGLSEDVRYMTVMLENFKAKSDALPRDKFSAQRQAALERMETQLTETLWIAMADMLESAARSVNVGELEAKVRKFEEDLSLGDDDLGKNKGLIARIKWEIRQNSSLLSGENPYAVALIYDKHIKAYERVDVLRKQIVLEVWHGGFGIDYVAAQGKPMKVLLMGGKIGAPALSGDPAKDVELAENTLAAHRARAEAIRADLTAALDRPVDAAKDKDHLKALGQIGLEWEHLLDDCAGRAAPNCEATVRTALQQRVKLYKDYLAKLAAGNQAVALEIAGQIEMKLGESADFSAKFAKPEDKSRPGLVLNWSVNGEAAGTGEKIKVKAEQAGGMNLMLSATSKASGSEKKLGEAVRTVTVKDPSGGKPPVADAKLAADIDSALKARDWKRLVALLAQVKQNEQRRIKDTAAWQADVDAVTRALDTLKKERMQWALAWKEYMDALDNLDSVTWDKLTRAVDRQRELVQERCYKDSSPSEDPRKRDARCQKEASNFYDNCLGEQPKQHFEERQRIRMAKEQLPDKVQSLHSAGYFTHKDWFEVVEKLTDEYKLPFPWPNPVTTRLKYAASCASVDLPTGEKKPAAADFKVTVNVPQAIVPYGKAVTLSASAQGGKAPHNYAWSTGASGQRASVTPRWAGEWTVTVTATDADGKTGEGQGTLVVSPAKVKMNGTQPQVFYGSRATLSLPGQEPPPPVADPCIGKPRSNNPYDECNTIKVDQSVAVSPGYVPPPPGLVSDPNQVRALPETAPPAGAGKQKVVWQSEPGVGFAPPTSEDGRTQVTYTRMGQVKLWCEILEVLEGAFHTVGECDQEVVNVVAPRFSVQFTPPEGQGRIGQDIQLRIDSQPGVADDLIDFRWFDPATSNRLELTTNAREISFKVKDAKPVVLKTLARVPKDGDTIAEIGATYTGLQFEVKAWVEEPGTRPMMWDPVKGGLKPVPKGQYATHERIPLRAELQGAAPPSGLRWNWTVNDGTTISNPISQTPTVSRSSPGGIQAHVEARDAEGAVLGSTDVSVSVIEVRDTPPAPLNPTVSLSANRTSAERGEAVSFSANATGGKPPYRYAWQGASGQGAQATLATTRTGSQSVSVTVTDSQGKTGTASVEINVTANARDIAKEKAGKLAAQASQQAKAGDLAGAARSVEEARQHDAETALPVAAQVRDQAKKAASDAEKKRDFKTSGSLFDAAKRADPADRDAQIGANNSAGYQQRQDAMVAKQRELAGHIARGDWHLAETSQAELKIMDEGLPGGLTPETRDLIKRYQDGQAAYARQVDAKRKDIASDLQAGRYDSARAKVAVLRQTHLIPADEDWASGISQAIDKAESESRGKTGTGGASSAVAGIWAVNANGYQGKLELADSGGRLTGRIWFDAHQRWEDLTRISYDPAGKSLRFTRPGPSQDYTARLDGNRLSGGFTYQGGNYGFEGNRQDGPANLPAGDVSGKWRTSEGEATLSQSGRTVKGSYTSDGGEIVGEMNGNVLEGYWIENGSSERCATAKNGRYHWGRIRWTFEGGRFTGTWSYCDKPLPASGSNWSGERIGAAPATPVATVPGAGGRDYTSESTTGAIASTPADTYVGPAQMPGNGRLVLEDDAGPYQWVDSTEVQTRKVHAGRAAFLSNGNDHFTHRLGLVGNYAGQYRYLDFWLYLDKPGADIQIQVQVDGAWGKRWGFDGDSRYNGYDWAMEGTTVNLPSGRWLHQRLDLIEQLHIHAGQAITGMAFSSDNSDVYYDSVYLLPNATPLPPPAVNPTGKRVLEDDVGPYQWIDATVVQKEVVAYGQAAFRSGGNDHFTADLGVVGDYPEQFRSISLWILPIGPEADIQLQVQVNGAWGKRWGFDAGPKYNGYDWPMEGTTTGLKPGVWQEIKVDLIRDLHINPGQKITGLAFSSDNGDVYYDSVYLHANPSPAVKPSFQPAGKRVLEDDAGGYNWGDASEVQDYLVFNGSRAFRSNGNDHFLADLGVAGNGSGQFRNLGFWAFFMGPEADIQLQAQVNGSWGKRWGFEAGPKYNGYDWAMEGTTANMPNGRWTWIQVDLLNQLHLKGGDRITGLAFSSDNADVAYDSVYLLLGGAGPSIAAGGQTGSASVQSGTGGGLRLDRTVYAPGENIAVHFTAPGTWARDAWIGIVPSAIPHGDERQNDNHDISYQYLDKRTSGTLTFTAPAAGDWDFRLHDTDNNGKEQSSVSFRVDAATMPGGRDYTGYGSTVASPGGQSGSGYLRIEACVDGSDWISVNNGNLNHQHRAFDQIGTHGGCPASHRVTGGGFLVDGLAVGLARLPLPVGMAGIGRFEVERGRGQVRLDGANRILIDDDGPGGSDLYVIRLYPGAAASNTPAVTTVPGGRDYTAAPVQGQLIFEVGNIGGVGNGPSKATRFTLAAPHVITLIRDYHWNSARGATPGSIALKGKDGGSHGPWQAAGSPGQGGAPNAYWTAYPNITLPAGTYTVIDSDPATWSHNAESNNRGFVRVEGYPADSGQSTALPTTGNAQVDGAIKEVDGLLDAVKSLKGLFGK